MKYDEAGLQALKTDSRFSDIGNLPSNFFGYPSFKELFIRPFTVNELKLISRAAIQKEVSHLIRAIDLVISEPAGILTIGDFYYILMWLRIHSMPKTPYVIEYHCKEPVIRHKTDGTVIFNDDTFAAPPEDQEDQYEIKMCDTYNSEIIHMTSVEILTLDETNFQGFPEGDVEFDFPRLRTLGEMQEALNDPELNLIVGAAQWIKEGATLLEKIEVLGRQPDLQVFDDASVINERVVHGIAESAVLSCRFCRKQSPHRLALDALSFFR